MRISLRKKTTLTLEKLSQCCLDWLIVGLGNPGARYATTRHNVGYMVTDQILAASKMTLTPVTGAPAQIALLPAPEPRIAILRSTTFMNESGLAVAPIANSLGIAANHILVIHDELDLPAGAVKLRAGGSENGHNGLKSISEQLGTREYLRVRIGISRPEHGASIPDWVLSPVDTGDTFDVQIKTAVEAVELVVTEGLSKAQNVIHSRA